MFDQLTGDIAAQIEEDFTASVSCCEENSFGRKVHGSAVNATDQLQSEGKVRDIVDETYMLTMEGNPEEAKQKLRNLHAAEISLREFEFLKGKQRALLGTKAGNVSITLKSVQRYPLRSDINYYDGPLLSFDDQFQSIPELLVLYKNILTIYNNPITYWYYLLLGLLCIEPDLNFYQSIFYGDVNKVVGGLPFLLEKYPQEKIFFLI